MDAGFNGLISSALPNIYVERIILEQTKFSAPDKSESDNKNPYFIADPSDPNAESAEAETNKLRIRINANIKIPDVSSDEILNFISDDNFMKYLYVYQFIFAKKQGRAAYINIMQNQNNIKQFVNSINLWFAGKPASLNQMMHGAPYDKPRKIALSDVLQGLIDPTGGAPAALQTTKNELQKYRVVLPDNRVIYQLPVRGFFLSEVSGINPSDLAYVTFVALDTQAILNDIGDVAEVPNNLITNTIGKITSEVIIKNKKLQTTGQIFVISNNQETEERSKAFSKYSGQVWLGGVHKMGPRYMAGNWHGESLHPFLDAHYVDNNKIQDFRQVARYESNYFNFAPFVNRFTGNYKNLSTYQGVVFDRLPIVSQLMWSRTPQKRVKLLFGIDWGKLLKRYSLFPTVMDKLANSGNTLNNIIDAAELIQLRIYRERIDISKNVVNRTGDRKMIYEGDMQKIQAKAPYKIFKPGSLGETAYSAVEKVNLYTTTANKMKFFTATDYDVASVKDGKFKYSIEMSIRDSTLSYVVNIYNNIIKAIEGDGNKDGLLDYLQKAETTGKFNIHTDTFSAEFITAITSSNNNYTAEGVLILVNNLLNSQNFKDLLATAQKDFNFDTFQTSLKGFLKPDVATLDSIAVANNVLNSIADRLRVVINAFSKKNIPKVNTIPATVEIYNSSVKSAPPAPSISLEHEFDSAESIVNTENIEAGYDFMIDVANLNGSTDVGLKKTRTSAYTSRVVREYEKSFFIKWGTPESLAVSYGENLPQKFDLQQEVYSYLTVPEYLQNTNGLLVEGGTKLPEYIKSANEFNSYKDLIVNILRYKNGLQGNFIGNNRKIVLGTHETGVNWYWQENTSEPVFNLVQQLAHEGVYVTPTEEIETKTLAKLKEEGAYPEDKVGGENQPDEEINVYTLAVPNEMRHFLSSILNLNSFLLTQKDLKLEEYNVDNPSSLIRNYITALGDALYALPNQIKALILLTQPNPSNIVQGFGGNSDYNQSNLKINKYGKLWFKHFNIAEVQYLQGFDAMNADVFTKLKGVPTLGIIPGTGVNSGQDPNASQNIYEGVWNQAINSASWQKLDKTTLDSVSSGQLLLCRLMRYKTPLLYNDKTFKQLELPLYNQYFLIEA